MSRVLVTGAGGFVGSHVARDSQRLGHATVALCRSLSVARLRLIAPDVQLAVLADVADSAETCRVISDLRPEIVVHTAGAGVGRIERYPGEFARTNVSGTENVLAAAVAADARRVIVIGSGFEYVPANAAQDEGARLAPDTLYGATKVAAAAIAGYYASHSRLEVVVVRPFSTYGPGERLTRFVPYVITQTIRREPIVMTKGSQLRDYLFIEDLAQAIIRIVQMPKVPAEVFNVGGPARHTLNNVVDLVADIAGYHPDVVRGVQQSATDRNVFLADSTRARRRLGWSAAHDLRAGLARTYAWYLQNRSSWDHLD
jgi:nucleoside-diphosphate-sugar epimerase